MSTSLNGGAGGNRTPVHQALFTSATTIPVVVLTQHRRRVDYLVTQAACGLSHKSKVFPIVSGLSRRHPPLLLPGCDGLAPCGIAAHDVSLPSIRRRERTARWQFCFLPRLTNLSNSGCTCKQRNCCRNLSAPLVGCVKTSVRRGDVNFFQDLSKVAKNGYSIPLR